MRLDATERKALKYALDGFSQIYFFGSRVDMKKRGDIDVLIVPDTKISSLR